MLRGHQARATTRLRCRRGRSDELTDRGGARRARRPLRARRRDHPPRRRLPQRRQGGPRRVGQSIAALARAGRATELPGIGATIQEKVLALADTGEIPALVKLRAKYPPGLVADHPPARARAQARAPAVRRARRSTRPRRCATAAQRASDPRPEGVRPEGRGGAARGARQRRARTDRDGASCSTARSPSASSSSPRSAPIPAAERVELAGSARRMADSVKDLDVIATAHRPARARARRGRAGARRERRDAERVGRASADPQRPRRRPADRRARPVRQPAPALHRLQAAQHGAARLRGAPRPARLRVRRARRRDRRDPPLRDRGGGLRAARPRLHRAGAAREPRRARGGRARPAGRAACRRCRPSRDLRGDLHCHTTASDGTASIEEMALAARDAGYEYLAITDHSASMGFGADVSPRSAAGSRSSGSARHRCPGSSCSPARRSTSCPTARSTTTTSISPSSTG